MEQHDWVEQVRSGDQFAFRQFYEAYANGAIRIASAITRNRELAKDAVQETFIRVFRQIDSYNPTLPFDPWFYRILTNECLRLINKETSLVKVEPSNLDDNPALVEKSFDQLSDLYDIIQSLDDLHRIPLILKYIKGFSEKEIADILQLNQNTLKSRLFKARKHLKMLLDPHGEEDVT